MAKNPSSQWFWNDWVLDANLRMCSMAAQGFWMQMLAIAASATPRGYVRVGDKACTIGDLARITGQDRRSVRNWVAELQQNCVLSVAANESQVEYISRRMVREETEEIRQKSARARATPPRATLTLDSDSEDSPLYPPRGIRKKNREREVNQNGVSEHRPAFGPLRDPVEIAKELGLRK